jgi:hypothetical protein
LSCGKDGVLGKVNVFSFDIMICGGDNGLDVGIENVVD